MRCLDLGYLTLKSNLLEQFLLAFSREVSDLSEFIDQFLNKER